MFKEFQQQEDFLTKIRKVEIPDKFKMLNNDRLSERLKYMQEELYELADSIDAYDQLDALIDLHYHILGSVVEMGVDFMAYQECFDKVHKANMQKLPGKDPVSGKPITKPEGWTPPDFTEIFRYQIEK